MPHILLAGSNTPHTSRPSQWAEPSLHHAGEILGFAPCAINTMTLPSFQQWLHARWLNAQGAVHV